MTASLEDLRAAVRHQVQFAGLLRVDHVMGLERTYCVPHGFDPTMGAYLRQPGRLRYATLLIEAERAGCALVGEDLGTVPASTERWLTDRGVLGMHVAQFEFGDADPGSAFRVVGDRVAAIGTHDMPRFAGWLQGADVEELKNAALLSDADAATRAHARRRDAKRLTEALGLPLDADGDATLDAVLHRLAQSSAAVVMVDLEDLWLEVVADNVPGTTTERANWQTRCQHSLDGLPPRVRAVLAALATARRTKLPVEMTACASGLDPGDRDDSGVEG